ncbi:hypothetical protein M0R45_006560 [Rubus argutus]|uniref:Uncharacterized protein n=1 Tax=Rubus argutus TaxID=59490 RepID=A0AAW1YRK9_RUBAR
MRRRRQERSCGWVVRPWRSGWARVQLGLGEAERDGVGWVLTAEEKEKLAAAETAMGTGRQLERTEDEVVLLGPCAWRFGYDLVVHDGDEGFCRE